MHLVGIWGRPYIDLARYLDIAALEALDDEICYGLALASPTCTGGGLKAMGVCAPSVMQDPYVDYGQVIAQMSRAELERLVSLAEDPSSFDPESLANVRFGDETDNPLTVAQARYLSYRYGVYFPWKVAYHFVENDRWDDKHSGAGKSFSHEARGLFPRTVAFLEKLPFREIGRCLVFGLDANDHAPLHRDTDPGPHEQIGHSMQLCPRGNKRFFVSDVHGLRRTFIRTKAYWFNDMDWHGVDPAPFFRYSIRVDGVFDENFYSQLERDHRAG